MYSKSHIIAEIKRTADANSGVALGKRRFEQASGIRESDWSGRYWATWGEAVRAAGYAPNVRTARRDSEVLLVPLALLARELGRFPTRAEMRLAARKPGAFPVSGIEHRFKSRAAQLAALVEFCRGHDAYADVVQCVTSTEGLEATSDAESASGRTDVGYVYLLKSGRHYKIGRSNAVGRRERELQIQLPERAGVVHSIKTDDPEGIERYWHGRFSERRKNGEWFQLTADDIRAFRRRTSM